MTMLTFCFATFTYIGYRQRILIDPDSAQKATDYIALLLLRNRGEIIVRLGRHPPLQQLFEAGADALAANAQGRGAPITSPDMDIALKTLEAAADSVGAKVRTDPQLRLIESTETLPKGYVAAPTR
jgi:hypothetical protein